MAGYQDEMGVGGFQPKTITGTAVHRLTNCYAIIPDNNGCVISELRRSDNESVNWVTELGISGVDISGHRASLICNPDYKWVEIKLASGMCQVGRIGKI